DGVAFELDLFAGQSDDALEVKFVAHLQTDDVAPLRRRGNVSESIDEIGLPIVVIRQHAFARNFHGRQDPAGNGEAQQTEDERHVQDFSPHFVPAAAHGYTFTVHTYSSARRQEFFNRW